MKKYPHVCRVLREAGNIKGGKTRGIAKRLKMNPICFQAIMSSNVLATPVALGGGWATLELFGFFTRSIFTEVVSVLLGLLVFLVIFSWLGGWMRMKLFLFVSMRR